jgi:hypothetical protein
MNVKHLEDFVKSMNPPLGFGNKCPKRQMLRNFSRMNLELNKCPKRQMLRNFSKKNLELQMRVKDPDPTPHVNFVSVMFGLVRLALGIHSKGEASKIYHLENISKV